MLHQAEMEGKEGDDFAREEAIHTEMLPELFQYGLKMIKLSGVETVDESDADEAEDEISEE